MTVEEFIDMLKTQNPKAEIKFFTNVHPTIGIEPIELNINGFKRFKSSSVIVDCGMYESKDNTLTRLYFNNSEILSNRSTILIEEKKNNSNKG